MKESWMKYLRLGVVLFVLYLAIHYWPVVSQLFLLAAVAAFPLFLGGAIAYAVNILMSLYERHLFLANSSPSARKVRRPLAITLSFATLSGIIFLLVRMILPELIQSVGLLVREATPRIEWLLNQVNQNGELSQLLSGYGLFLPDGNLDWSALFSSLDKGMLDSLSGVMGSVMGLILTLCSTAFTFVVSVIFSIYLLMGKEKLRRQFALILWTYLEPTWYLRTKYFLKTLNSCFRRFVVGQCMEAVILGLLCMLGMILFGFPYATMVGTLVGFTALIPVAGAYIGAGVGAFLIFTVSPMKALLFLLFILILQQLEGNLIYPKVVGSSIGLPGIWVLAAVTIGGGILGIFGMLLGVPLAATCYQVLKQDVSLRSGISELENEKRT